MGWERNGSIDFETDLQKVIHMLASGKEKRVDLIEFSRECTQLFEKLEAHLRGENARDKEAAHKKIKELSALVEDHVQDLCHETGKNEEEISAYIENPDNFSQDVWQALQKANRQILSGKQSRRKKRTP